MTQEELKTKDLILDIAEELFADQGFHGTSIRDITGKAGVHIGSVNYHFSSKEKLFQALIARKISKVNDDRIALLDEYEQAAAPAALEIEKVLQAFLLPPFQFGREGNEPFIRLMGRLYVDPGQFWEPVFELFEDVVKRFGAALFKAAPHLSEKELVWRFHFMVGSMCHCLMDSKGIKFLSKNSKEELDMDDMLDHLVSFTAAGFMAPVKENTNE